MHSIITIIILIIIVIIFSFIIIIIIIVIGFIITTIIYIIIIIIIIIPELRTEIQPTWIPSSPLAVPILLLLHAMIQPWEGAVMTQIQVLMEDTQRSRITSGVEGQDHDPGQGLDPG
jgi:hypothetical protein